MQHQQQAGEQSESWVLGELLNDIVDISSIESIASKSFFNQNIVALALDSREVCPDALFFALKGEKQHGLQFAQQAVEKGAVAVLWESGSDAQSDSNSNSHSDLDTDLYQQAEKLSVPAIAVPDLREKMGLIADRFFAYPSKNLKIAAVTGTDGKTSVTHFIAMLMASISDAGKAGLMGTLGAQTVDAFGQFADLAFDLNLGEDVGSETEFESGTKTSDFFKLHLHTTADAISVHQQLAKFRANQIGFVAMEASSHGIHQQRLAGVAIDVAALTQLGSDHLDYHGTLAAYREAKQALFFHPGLKAAVLNAEDDLGREIAESFRKPRSVTEMMQALKQDRMQQLTQVITYGIGCEADLRADIVSQDQQGIAFTLQFSGQVDAINPFEPVGQQVYPLRTKLYGRFNLSNLLAAMGTLLCWGVPLEQVVAQIPNLGAVSGRMEQFRTVDGKTATLVVDYAHTPGALESVLTALRDHLPFPLFGNQANPSDQVNQPKLWVIFGCGGDRDQKKRPHMGKIAEQLADKVIVTNDNPRSENQEAITDQILAGMAYPENVTVIHDRKQSIETAFHQAGAEDVILIAGKGHEDYQEINGKKYPLSDREIAQNLVGLVVAGDAL